MADAFDEFLEAGGGEDADDGGMLGDITAAGLGAADAVADLLFGEDADDTVFGIGEDADPGGAIIPGGGGYGTELAGLADPASSSAAMQLVSAIMSSGVVGALARQMLDRLPGVIFDSREPTWNGDPLTEAMLAILFRKLTKSEQEAVVERLAGGMAPISDTKAVRKNYRMLFVYDSLRSLNEQDAAEAIFHGLK